ncbi:MAG: aspartate carbamoyltransferase [Gammaproteobacteria bacterium]|nr:aspartate carbamoyltransferase [Gammaproteobacteria bacterium]
MQILQKKLKHGLITLSNLDKNEILQIVQHAQKFKDGYNTDSLSGRTIASLFFESSTRTRLSFETAIQKLGGNVIGFSEPSNTSLGSKNESIVDTLKIIGAYSDAIVMRHPNDGASKLAQEVLSIPIINAGDGGNLHPTQTLLDLFTIYETQGTLENINLALMGDLKYSRTIRSLLEIAVLFNMKIFFIADEVFYPNKQYLEILEHHNISYSFHDSISEVISELDIMYITRLQKERFKQVSKKIKNLILEPQELATAKDNLRILHPLPRNEEIPITIDDTPYAYYFQQARNGLFVRMALLDIIMGEH